ncbi:MAG: ATP-dependent DNA helicase [Burkholderiaceae bacterium]|nr:MAG: ATP-dependent DNA helicase [Burkholderiaceae bacterium]
MGDDCERAAVADDAGALESAVRAVLGEGGALTDAVDDYRPRAEQVRMAQAVARSIERGGALVVEAPTGVGKTFAYLVPALLSGERVILSTATKALQDQLYARDLPRLARALKLPVRKALLKGRSSYLCLHRLEQAVHGEPPAMADARAQLAEIERWSKTTRTGDLAELPWLDERSPLIPQVTSTHENCLGADCPQFQSCHVNLARRQAVAADVVVINHHLFFADLAIRESGMAELLPTVRCVIFDEAHRFNETGIQFLGEQLSSAQLLNLGRDVLAAGLKLARGQFDWRTLSADLEEAARDLRLAVGTRLRSGRLRWREQVPEGVDEAPWAHALERCDDALTAVEKALQTAGDFGPDFMRLRARADRLLQQVHRFAGPLDPARVRWVDVGSAVRLVESPLDVAETVRTRLLDVPVESDGPDRQRAWIFVSATLGDEDHLAWFTQPCGLQDAEVLRLQSPFCYPEQAGLYVPPGLVAPSDPAHSTQVARLVAEAAGALGGRTLVLTTTLRALQHIGAALQELLLAHPELEVLQQGRAPKRVLMERFRHGGQRGTGCVLVASASFWEGFDVPGDALQLVVIDKLPFPPPDDPLVDARCRRIETEGGRAFQRYLLPATAVALKQGAGRLIRNESDRGILVICDVRLRTKSYGKRLLAALPPMRALPARAEFETALHDLSAVNAGVGA